MANNDTLSMKLEWADEVELGYTVEWAKTVPNYVQDTYERNKDMTPSKVTYYALKKSAILSKHSKDWETLHAKWAREAKPLNTLRDEYIQQNKTNLINFRKPLTKS